jgi:hypothetical protein
MLGGRGGLGRIAARIREHARRRFEAPEEPRFEPVRDDVAELGDGYTGEAARTGSITALPSPPGDGLPDASSSDSDTA